VSNGFGRGAYEGEQALPGVLPYQSHPSVFLNGTVNEGIPVNLLQNGIQIFIQPEEMDQEAFFHSFIEENVPFLPEREELIAGLNQVSFHDFGIPEKLAAF
jgi:hypothetical protein